MKKNVDEVNVVAQHVRYSVTSINIRTWLRQFNVIYVSMLSIKKNYLKLCIMLNKELILGLAISILRNILKRNEST